MTTTVLLDAVRPYAHAVRTALADLPPDLVEDLTDGLEADLVAALADRDLQAGPPGPDEPARVFDPVAHFGPAGDYAAELRAAAGLAPAVPAGAPRSRARDRWRARRDAAAARVTSRPWWPPVGEFLVAMRPVWWAVRGWVVFGVLSFLLSGLIPADRAWVPDSLLRWLILGALVVLSAQWGRGLGPKGPWWDRARVLATALGLILLIPAVATASAPREVGYAVSVDAPYDQEAPDGVWVEGMQVSNLFVYGPDGEPVVGAQVFDDRGRPVATVSDEWSEWYLPGVSVPWRFAPVTDENGRTRWNVYPLLGAPSQAWQDGPGGPELAEGGRLQVPPMPFAKAPALAGTVADPPPATAGEPSGDAADEPSGDASDGPSPAADDPTTPPAGTGSPTSAP